VKRREDKTIKMKAVLCSTLVIAISLVLSGLAPSAHAISRTITFDAAQCPDAVCPQSYTENGITVTAETGSTLSFGDFGTPASQALINTFPNPAGSNLFGPIYTFTFAGGAFDVLFVDIVDTGAAQFVPTPDTIPNSSTLAGGFPSLGTVGDPMGGGLNGSGWLNITSFTYRMGPDNFGSSAIDNLVIDDLGFIPEPGTLLLLGSGLAGLGFFRRRKKREA